MTQPSEQALEAAQEIEITFPQLPNYSEDKIAIIIDRALVAQREELVGRVKGMRAEVQEEADAERPMGWVGAAAQLTIIDEIITALEAEHGK